MIKILYNWGWNLKKFLLLVVGMTAIDWEDKILFKKLFIKIVLNSKGVYKLYNKIKNTY